MENQVETVKYTPEKAKQNALAKLDLICKWQEFRYKAVNKLQADYDFVKLHNSSNSYLFSVLGKISQEPYIAGKLCSMEQRITQVLSLITNFYNVINL